VTPVILDRDAIYGAIKSAFSEFYNLARIGLRKRWKSLTPVERAQAARSLVFMKELATNPAKYFSRANTGAAWVKRANDFAEQHNSVPANMHHAYYIVHGPKEIVAEKARAAWIYNADIANMFYRFCKMVQDWEYKRTSPEDKEFFEAKRVAEDIVNASKRYTAFRKTEEPSKVQTWLQKNMKCLVK